MLGGYLIYATSRAWGAAGLRPRGRYRGGA